MLNHIYQDISVLFFHAVKFAQLIYTTGSLYLHYQTHPMFYYVSSDVTSSSVKINQEYKISYFKTRSHFINYYINRCLLVTLLGMQCLQTQRHRLNCGFFFFCVNKTQCRMSKFKVLVQILAIAFWHCRSSQPQQ